jgi:hypothetical protein
MYRCRLGVTPLEYAYGTFLLRQQGGGKFPKELWIQELKREIEGLDFGEGDFDADLNGDVKQT